MDCSRSQAALSERMDGEHLAPRVTAALDQHLAGCATCRAFEQRAYRLREQVRFGVAPAVPDLVGPIMAAIERESQVRAPARTRMRVMRSPRELRPRRRLLTTLAPAVAALLVGAIAGSLLVGGPFRQPGGGAIAAATVTRGVASAASELSAYQASFQITEYHFATDVPVRELSMNVWFEAPEKFRLDIADHTSYPRPDFTPTDLSLVVNGSTWSSSGPAPCQFAQCPQEQTVITHRVPFSSTTPAPTDLVLPVTTLADANQLTVPGRGTVLGRSAVEVQLPFERAEGAVPIPRPRRLVAAVLPQRPGRVVARRLELVPAAMVGVPGERPRARSVGAPVRPAPGAVETRDLRGVRPVGGRTRADAGHLQDPAREDGDRCRRHRDRSRRRVETDGIRPGDSRHGRGARSVPSRPASRRGAADGRRDPHHVLEGPVLVEGGRDAELEPGRVLRAGRVPRAAGPAVQWWGRVLRAGLDRPRPPRVDPLGGHRPVRRDEPLARGAPRRGGVVAGPWHRDPRVMAGPDRAGGRDRARLARRGGRPTVVRPPRATPAPDRLRPRERRAREGAGPSRRERVLPASRRGSRLRTDPVPRRSRAELPPASAASQSAVEVRGTEGRWTPDREQLEWVEDGVYYSLDASGLGLEDLLAVAASIGPLSTVDAGAAPSPSASAEAGS